MSERRSFRPLGPRPGGPLPATRRAVSSPAARGPEPEGETVADLGLRPRSHGFPFINQSTGGATWELYQATFPGSRMETRIFGRTIHHPLADAFYKYFYKDIINGPDCFGISVACFLFFLGKEKVSAYTAAAATAFQLEGPERPGDELQRLIHIWHGRQMTLGPVAYGVQRWLKANTVKDSVDAIITGIRAHDPPVIAFFPTLKQLHDPQKFIALFNDAHVVAAYRVDQMADHTYRVYFYDPNHPYNPNEVAWEEWYAVADVAQNTFYHAFDGRYSTEQGDMMLTTPLSVITDPAGMKLPYDLVGLG